MKPIPKSDFGSKGIKVYFCSNGVLDTGFVVKQIGHLRYLVRGRNGATRIVQLTQIAEIANVLVGNSPAPSSLVPLEGACSFAIMVDGVIIPLRRLWYKVGYDVYNSKVLWRTNIIKYVNNTSLVSSKSNSGFLHWFGF